MKLFAGCATRNQMPAAGGWAISQNKATPEGTYATKEGAFEAVYPAASNDIKMGLGVAITIEPPRGGESVIGGEP
jgi:hypothetical protein